MKKSFLMMAMAGLMFCSCSKDDSAPVGGDQLKSVKFSLSNVVSTRGVDAPIADNASVVLNNFQIWFADASGNTYAAKDVDGNAATHYFTSDLTSVKAFHFLPAAVTKVIVLGNYGSALTVEGEMVNAVKALTTTAADQQDDANLWVYGEANLVAAGAQAADGHGNLYTASVTVKPLIARLEVAGFQCTFSETPLYDKLDLSLVALNKIYNQVTVSGAYSQEYFTTLTNASAYSWFDQLPTIADRYSYDNIAVSLTPAAPAVALGDGSLAYHFIPTGANPQLAIKVKATKGTNEYPVYLATTNFKDASGVVITPEAGHVYRMSPYFKFSDSDLDHPEKCIEVTVVPSSWHIVAVDPVF